MSLDMTTMDLGDSVPLLRVGFHLLLCQLCQFTQLNTVGTIDFLRCDANLLFDGQVHVVEELERGRAFTGSDHCFRQSLCSLTTQRYAASQGLAHDQFQFCGRIRPGEIQYRAADLTWVNVSEAIDGHDGLQSKLSGILNMLGKVLDTFFEDGKVLVEGSVIQHFEGSSGYDDYDCIRNKTADSALDVAKLLHAHVSTEAALGQYIEETSPSSVPASLSATRSARMEEFPWAIFPKGPACTKTGVP